MTTTIRAIPGFLPSTAGFHFANRWPHGPAIRLGLRVSGPVPVALELRIGDAADGLCGGMALAARDRWLRGEPPPNDAVPPPEGTPLFEEIVRGQLASLESGAAVARFYRAGAASPSGRARIAVRDAWPAIRRQIEEGRPAVVGLVHVATADPRRLGANHQVLAHAYELDGAAGRLTVSVYDPNHPDDDSIRLGLTLDVARTGVSFSYRPGDSPVIGIVAR
jgi:hypothetical protein